uniref:Uncharacterized protein n=1 Tax=Meloidogyne enterolobii TaxID=390850 RepID=A0A6V7TXF6_MELEN|nr:unnamed protein product [Meloidogyne enterolobii]
MTKLRPDKTSTDKTSNYQNFVQTKLRMTKTSSRQNFVRQKLRPTKTSTKDIQNMRRIFLKKYIGSSGRVS